MAIQRFTYPQEDTDMSTTPHYENITQHANQSTQMPVTERLMMDLMESIHHTARNVEELIEKLSPIMMQSNPCEAVDPVPEREPLPAHLDSIRTATDRVDDIKKRLMQAIIALPL